MIVSAAFCPHPPVLVPSVAGRAQGELDELRDACRAAVAAMVSTGPDRIVVVGSGTRSRLDGPLDSGSLAGYGVDARFPLGSPACGGDEDLPLSLTVGAWLLADTLGPRSGALGLEVDAAHPAVAVPGELVEIAEAQRVGLLVMGDGSARRGVGAPGYLDDRAEPFDLAVQHLLAAGDAEALADLDPVLGRELLAAGVPAWRAAGSLIAGSDVEATLLYAAAPYGVGYLVASWTVVG